MSRINTNVVSLLAQRNLATANASVNRSLERLSTGLRINRGADDPAGLIASERLRSEKVALQSAISNSVRATNLIGTAEGSLNEMNSLLLDIQSMVDTAANSGGMTTAEVAANQLLVDEAIASISRTAATSQFNGKKLLDGSLGFTANAFGANIDSATVNQAVFEGGSKTVTVNATGAAAEKALLTVSDANAAAASGNVRIEGNKGVAVVAFTLLMTGAQFQAAINAVTDITGVQANDSGATTLINSVEYGSSQKVKLVKLDGATLTTTEAVYEDYGANATITSVDGSLTGVSVEGLKITVKRTGLEADIYLKSTIAGAEDFTIMQGGAKFQVGPELNTQNQVNIGINAVTANDLGQATLGYLTTLGSGSTNDLDSGNFATAGAIVAKAIDQISTLRGRLGALQKNTLEASIRSLGSTLENITSAESTIRDTDFAAETANLTRAQILSQAGTSVLAMANAAPQNVLALLGR